MRKVECVVRRFEYQDGVNKEVFDHYTGVFHQWGTEYEEFESGPGNYSVAIVELPNGKVNTFQPHQVKFID